METFKCRFQGTYAMLMNRIPDDFEADSSETIRKASGIKTLLPREVAERGAYRMKDGRLYVPSEWIERGFSETSGNYKQRGTRKSLKYVALSAFEVFPEQIPFVGDLKQYEVFAKPANNRVTKGKIMTYRPRIEEWAISFEVKLDTSLMTASDAKKILDEMGVKNGLGSWRPQKAGKFGRFIVTLWEPLDAKKDRVYSHTDGEDVTSVVQGGVER